MQVERKQRCCVSSSAKMIGSVNISFNEAIVLKAREQGVAGVTVLLGPMGFGHSSRLHTAKILRLSEDLPVVVEIIDSEQNITAFLPLLEEMVKGGLVSIEEVRILRYGPDRKLSSSTVAVEGS